MVLVLSSIGPWRMIRVFIQTLINLTPIDSIQHMDKSSLILSSLFLASVVGMQDPS